MILLVDDKPENLFSLRKILESNSFEVDTALSGEEALKKILRQTYHLIILDVQMPGMDGFEVAETLAGFSRAKDVPIIFLSAVNTDKRFISKGYASGAVDYLVKPVDADILALKVRTLYLLSERTQALKKAEHQLTQTNQQLISILESLPQIAFTLLPNGTVEYVNARWYSFSKHKTDYPGTMVGETEIGKVVRKGTKQDASFEQEVILRNIKDNKYYYHLLKMVPNINNDQITRWVGTFTDIHEQKTLNMMLEKRVEERTEELVLKNRQLDESNHELQQFATVASHDLKEPLRKLQIMSDLLLNYKMTEENDTVKSYLSKIAHASTRMNNLINDLLSYSRLSTQEAFVEVDLNQLVQEVMSDLEMSITEKNAVITYDDLPTIQAIPGQIRQLFQNLISNSLKFTLPDATPNITISARTIEPLNHSDSSPWWEITVKDNGIGFNEMFLDRIFVIFQRLHPREKYEGTGIGLAITKKIVDKHGGLITAKSEDGKGAAFIITLPEKQNAIINKELTAQSEIK